MPNSKSPQHGALAQLDISALPGEVVASLFDRNPLPMWIYDLQSLAFLAVNDAAVERYGYSREDFLAMTIADIRPSDDIEALHRNIAAVGDSIDRAGTWRHVKKDGELIHVEITSYPLDFLARRAELVIAYDVSRQVADEANLSRLLELERIIASISRRLYELSDLDAAIDEALSLIGRFSGASRAYLFCFDLDTQFMYNSHEWCALDVEPHKAQLQALSTADFRWSLEPISAGETLSVPDVSALPDAAKNEREILQRQAIKSLILVPLPGGANISGFLGFDNVFKAGPWDERATHLLEIAAELIGAAMQRRKDREALAFSAQQLQSVMRSAEHFVFYRLSVDPSAAHHAQVEFVTDSLREIVGVDPAAPFQAWFEHVHPDDVPRLEAENEAAAAQGQGLDITIRMRPPERQSWRWIRVVSNPVRDVQGVVTHFNGILLDVSDTVNAAQALKAERDFAAAVMDTVGALIVVMDRDGRIVQFNRACESLTGYDFDEVKDQFVWDFLILPEEREGVQQVFTGLKRLPRQSHYENYWLSKDGRKLLIEWSNTAILDSDGKLRYAIATGIDITERRQAESTVRKLSGAVDQTANGIVIVNREGIVEYANPAYAEIRGEPPEHLLGKPAEFLGSRSSHGGEHALIWQHMLEGKTWRGELERQKHDGGSCWLALTVSPVRNPVSETTHYVVHVEDITRLKDAQRDLERMATFDPLTALPNRRLFRDRLSHALDGIERYGHRLALLYLDLDNFKRVNDSLGHDVGDMLLREVAQRLGHTVRREDTVARLGGDEFVILVQLSDDTFDVGRLAQKLLLRVREPIIAAQHEVVITASIGITFAPSDSLDPGILLRNADLAMYRVKGRGRDAYGFFEGRMNLEAARRLSMEGELRRAFKDERIQPYFQPIIRLQDLRIVGFEALARWPSPEQGFVPPDQFIPVAEECGLILPLGEYLLERSAEHLVLLRRALDDDLYVAVNLSARQTYDARLFDQIVAILERTGLPPEGLRLELTESLLMRDVAVTGTLLQRLREHLGTRVAIDDFGTGYSSLSYLKQLPIDALKVDRSFVKDVPDDPNDMEITAAVIVMARALNKDVVAEGVETRAQLDFLRAQGCGFAQGYLLGRPAPPQQFAEGPLNLLSID